MDSHLFFPIKHAKQKHEQSRAHKKGQEHAKSENNKNVKNCTKKVVYFAFFSDITIGKQGKWVPLMIVWCFFQRFGKWWINQCLDSLHFPSIGKVVSHRRSQGDKIIGWEYWSKWMVRNWVCRGHSNSDVLESTLARNSWESTLNTVVFFWSSAVLASRPHVGFDT